jgi:hypothetical protein
MAVATDAARADTFSRPSSGAHLHPGEPAYRRNDKDIVRHPETWPASRLRRALISAREVPAFKLAGECSEPAA